MYNLITAFVKEKANSKAWTEADLADVVLFDMQDRYSDVHLHVTTTQAPAVVRRINWADIRGSITDLTATLEEHFLRNGNKTLKTYATLASIESGEVRYADVLQADYKVDIINRNYAVGNANATIDANDVYLHKPGVDPIDFKDHCLVVVNDLLHFVDADTNYIYVTDAMKTCRLSGRNELGIINFKNIGKITCHPITEAMLSGESATRNKLGEKFYIKLPTSAKGKLVGISLGGYFHLLNSKVFYPISDTYYCFDVRNIELVDRIFESEDIIDLSSLGLERAGRNDKQLSKEQLYSNEVIKKYATLSQSFLIVFDNPEVIKEMVAIQESALPGMYVTPTMPRLPIFYKKGMLASYRMEQDLGAFAIRTHRGFYNHYMMHTTTTATNPADNRVPHDPRKRSHAYFLKLSTTKLKLA